MKLEFGGQSFFRIQKLNSRVLFRQRVNEHLFNLFKYSLIIIVIIIIIIIIINYYYHYYPCVYVIYFVQWSCMDIP